MWKKVLCVAGLPIKYLDVVDNKSIYALIEIDELIDLTVESG